MMKDTFKIGIQRNANKIDMHMGGHIKVRQTKHIYTYK